MRPADAKQLLANAGKPVNLLYRVNGRVVKIQNLYVISAAPQDQPQIAKVTVVDRRWLWRNNWILRRYNMRRNIGVKRVTNYGTPELAAVLPEVWYWPWSLKTDQSGGTWKAKDVLADVISEVAQTEKGWSGSTMPFIDDTGDLISQVPIENLEVHGRGPDAINRVLNYLPGVGIKVVEDGSVVAFDKTAGGEMAVVAQLGPEVAGHGHVTLIDNRILRPKRVVMLTQREIEIRLDYTESSGGTVALPGIDSRFLENVGQVTDPQLAASDGNLYAEGTWLPFDTLFASWQARNGFTLSHDLVQQAFVPWFDLWADIVGVGEFDPSAVWASRVAMIQRCYRQTFRISSRWMSRILSLRAYRIATVDQTTGTRAPAAVYADHSIIPSMRGKLAAGIDNQYFCANVEGYSTSIGNDTVASPAVLEVVDADQGIIGINYKIDPLMMNQMVLPSKIQNVPNGNIRNPRITTLSFDSACAGVSPPRLSPSFKMATILSAVPASPNSDQQLHRTVVEPADVADMIGDVAPCDGPEMEIFVGPNIVTAKIRWLDSRAGDIEKCFGIGIGAPNLTGLILNDGPSSPSTGASLTNVAHAIAAQIYAQYVDRPQGQQAGHIKGGIELVGYIDEVTHELSPKGVGLTRVSLPGQIQPLSLKSYLDPSSIAAIDHLVQPPGAT